MDFLISLVIAGGLWWFLKGRKKTGSGDSSTPNRSEGNQDQK